MFTDSSRTVRFLIVRPSGERYLFTDWCSQTCADAYVISQLILHPQHDSMAATAPETEVEKTPEATPPRGRARQRKTPYLTRGREPWLLIGWVGTHWVKSNVMTAADGVRARHGYSHRGWGSASRDSRKSRERCEDRRVQVSPQVRLSFLSRESVKVFSSLE